MFYQIQKKNQKVIPIEDTLLPSDESLEPLLELMKDDINKVGDYSRGRPKGSLFKSFYTEVLERALFFFLDWSILPLIRTL